MERLASDPAADSAAIAIAAVRRGEMVVLLASGGRDEADLVMACERIDADDVNFMAIHGRGLTAVASTAERLAELGIPPIGDGSHPNAKRFHVAVDLAEKTTTGISAADRAVTMRAFAASDSKPDNFNGPGHIFSLACEPDGVLARAGRAEAAVDLVRAAGFPPAAAICEILNEDGELAAVPELVEFAQQHRLATVTVDDLVAHRHRTGPTIERVREADVVLAGTTFRALEFRRRSDCRSALALVAGDVRGNEDAFVYAHCECVLGDVFGGCPMCGPALGSALERISAASTGALIYLRGEGISSCAVGSRPDMALCESIARAVVADLQIGPARLHGIDADELDWHGPRSAHFSFGEPPLIAAARR